MGVAPAIAARRRAPLKRLAGGDGNQARLRRLTLQRQSPEDQIPNPDLEHLPDPPPKPWFQIGDWKFDPFVSHPDAPHKWDPPGPGGAGTGGSLEDVHKGISKPKPVKAQPHPTEAPPCQMLQSVGDFKSYEFMRAHSLGPSEKTTWPALTEAEFKRLLAWCKSQPAPAAEPAATQKGQKGKTPRPSLPPGAY